jgi:CheY-like chemotaxis protein/HPt (histidine-containing phosphotransfer) domain-containing protein
MGGTIDVQSETGKGSEFSFSINFIKASAQDKIQLTSHHPNEHSIKSTSTTAHSISSYEGDSNLKILVAEDNKVNCKVTLLQLQKIGHTADVAENGEEVLEALNHKAYDVILMDCQMPVMDGFKTTREIRRRYRRPIRIIALTANAMKDDRERCLKAGMDDYLSKPLRSEDLAAALGSFTPATPSTQAPPSCSNGPIDLERLREITDNDKEFAKQLIKDYLTQAEEILTDMKSVIHAGNFEDMRRLAHKLAGSSASCGMNAVVPTLREIEALSVSNSDQAFPLYEETVRQLKEMREFLTNNSI